MPYAIIAHNSSIHSFTKCRPFDPRDPIDIDFTEHILQQYTQNHKQQMKQVYDIINKLSLENRTALIENRNKIREPEVEYTPQQVFVKNPFASRQKTAPRYTQDPIVTGFCCY